MRALALAAFAMIAVAGAGCSTPDLLVRDIAGTVKSPQGHTIDAVEMSDPTSGATTEGSIDTSGAFRVTVYGSGVVRVVFRENDVPVGVVEFDDGHGGAVSVFSITDEPEPGAAPQNGPSGGSESSVNYVYAKTSIDLGVIEDKEGKGIFRAERNPLAHVDTDGDGTPDFKDDDDDGDGLEDTEDDDANGNGTPDIYESADQDKNGIPDVIEAPGQGV